MEIRNLIQTPTLDQDKRKISGTAVVFNKRSEDLGGFTEIVEPNAFDGVDLSDVVLLYNHDTGDVLARTSAKTLNLNIDEQGVHFNATLPKTTLGNDTLTNLENRNVQGMSFGFTIAPQGEDWREESDGSLTHIVTRIGQLFELSLTPFPAYKATDVAVSHRSMEKFLKTQQENAADKEWLALQRDMYLKGEK